MSWSEYLRIDGYFELQVDKIQIVGMSWRGFGYQLYSLADIQGSQLNKVFVISVDFAPLILLPH